MAKAIAKSTVLTSGAVVTVAISDKPQAFLHFKKNLVEGEELPIKCWDEDGIRNTMVCISIEALAAVYQLIGDHLRKSDEENEVGNG